MITKQFEKVIEKVGSLPEDDQNALAEWILEELEDEKRWQKSFSESQDVLEKMAEKALKDREQGTVKPFDLSGL